MVLVTRSTINGGVRGRLTVGIVYDPFDWSPAFAVVGTSSDDQVDVLVVPQVSAGENSFVYGRDEVSIGFGDNGGDSIAGNAFPLGEKIYKIKFLGRAYSKANEAYC